MNEQRIHHFQTGLEHTGVGFDYRPEASATFFEREDTLRWLAEGVLLEGQATVIGAPKKALLTSLALDLAISLATATPFLNHFTIARAYRVAYMTGKSRTADVRSKATPICEAKGVEPSQCGIIWQFALPRICCREDLSRLAIGLRADGVQVVFFDPLFLLLRDGAEVSAANVYELGPALEQLIETCLGAGATPILVHHATKNAGKSCSDVPLGLEELSFAGVGEVARQWLLINRRREYVYGSGVSHLNLAVGGTAGQSSLWRLAVAEGTPGRDLNGRRWQVVVEAALASSGQARSGHVRAAGPVHR